MCFGHSYAPRNKRVAQREPINPQCGGGLESVEAANKTIALAIGADDCWNANRLLRVPGTVNVLNKTKAAGRAPALAYLVEADWSRTIAHDVVPRLPAGYAIAGRGNGRDKTRSGERFGWRDHDAVGQILGQLLEPIGFVIEARRRLGGWTAADRKPSLVRLRARRAGHRAPTVFLGDQRDNRICWSLAHWDGDANDGMVTRTMGAAAVAAPPLRNRRRVALISSSGKAMISHVMAASPASTATRRLPRQGRGSWRGYGPIGASAG
jgi:hypothetical protein